MVTGALLCCTFRKEAQEKFGGGVCLCLCMGVCLWCVCVCLYVCEGGTGDVYHTQRFTNLLFILDLYNKKQNDD